VHVLHVRTGTVSWSPCSGLVGTAGSDRSVKVWEAITGASVRSLYGHTDSVLCVEWSPCGGMLASSCGEMDCTVRVWDATTGTLLHILQANDSHYGEFYSLAWSPDGRLVATGSHHTVGLWDVATGAVARVLWVGDEKVHCLAWSPCSRLVFADAGPAVRIYRVSVGQ
jgi:WD40 repeat protein